MPSSKKRYDPKDYVATTAAKAAAGVPSFDYSRKAMSGSVSGVHPTLNIAGKIRECLISPACPEPTDITVCIDVTGSGNQVPGLVQKDCPRLMGLLQYKGWGGLYPQIMFAGLGDAYSDKFPLMVGQWEYGNEMDDQLDNIILEGRGGGQQHESYELFLAYMAYRTKRDMWIKNRKKGYIFIIGDEMPYNEVDSDQWNSIVQPDEPLTKNIPFTQVMKDIDEQYYLHYIVCGHASYYNDPTVANYWESICGERFHKLENASDVSELIATIVGLSEGAVDWNAARDELLTSGSSYDTVNGIEKAIALMPQTSALSANGIPVASATPSARKKL